MNSFKLDRKYLPAVLVALSLLVFGVPAVIFGRPLVEFVADREAFVRWLEGYGMLSRIIFVFLVVVQIVIAFIPGQIFEMAAGYAFGPVEGTVLCLVGTLLGSAIVFSLARFLGRRVVRLFFSEDEIEQVLSLEKSRKIGMAMAVLYILPGTPKDVMCYCAGLTKISMLKWLLLSTLGKIPAMLSATVGGGLMGSGRILEAVLIFSAVCAVSLGGWLYYKKHVSLKD